jgi:hypothetical protein
MRLRESPRDKWTLVHIGEPVNVNCGKRRLFRNVRNRKKIRFREFRDRRDEPPPDAKKPALLARTMEDRARTLGASKGNLRAPKRPRRAPQALLGRFHGQVRPVIP